MNHTISEIPFFQEVSKGQNILLAGAGGGFDFFSAIPLYFNLKKQGKHVVIANLSFTWLGETTSENVYPYCYKIDVQDRDLSGRNYFPEKYLKLWFLNKGIDVEMYGFDRTGINPLRDAYKYLIQKHNIDTIVLVDGGTDSLMFGDEEGLGTPQEDICSMAAVYESGVPQQYLVSVGFGIDHFHGVSHFRFLENVAELSRGGGYLGLFQMIQEMDEAQRYIEAVNYVNGCMQGMESIVSNSIVSALEGNYGDYHKTSRTIGSDLWINPLMTIYWCFDLRKVVHKIKYYEWVKDTNTIGEFNAQLSKYRDKLESFRDKRKIPI